MESNQTMKHTILIITTLLLAPLIAIHAAEPDEAVFTKRRDAVLQEIEAKPWPSPDKEVGSKQQMALLHLFRDEKVEESNRMVLDFCRNSLEMYRGKMGPVYFCTDLFRTCLMDATRKLLTKEAREATEDYAWNVVTKYSLGMSRATVDKAELAHFLLPNNGQTYKWRRYYFALLVVSRAERYGPKAMLEGHTVEDHYHAWDKFFLRFFHTFPNEGTDMDIAHPTAYGQITTGFYYDLYDLSDDPDVRKLAGEFLTLFWAEVAAEFEPRTGIRTGMATTRFPVHSGGGFWATRIVYCYGWHDINQVDPFVGQVSFLTSCYRPPAIVSAIARDRDRGCYMATSRRPGLTAGDGIKQTETVYRDDIKDPRIILDKNCNSFVRRDVYYTPDYALGTLATDPKRSYISDVVLTPMTGATFAASQADRIVVMGDGYYASRSTSGITGKAVSIIARDPNAALGRGRFQSDGTKVFISNGDLWTNRIEDQSGWLFTRAGNAYAAIRPASGGYHITHSSFHFTGFDATPKLTEIPEEKGQFLLLNDMWAPVVLQLGRAADYKSFEDFQASVKAKRLEYTDGKLTYISEAKDTYEYWAKGTQPPRFNGAEVNLNPPKTFDSPYLSMEHGSFKAVITYPGHKDLVLDFGEQQSH